MKDWWAESEERLETGGMSRLNSGNKVWGFGVIKFIIYARLAIPKRNLRFMSVALKCQPKLVNFIGAGGSSLKDSLLVFRRL